MKDKVRKYAVIALIAVAIVLAAETLYIRFTNPDMTQMRFFIDHWELSVGFFVSWMTALYLMETE